MIPLIDIKAQNACLEAELLAACQAVIGSGAYILGEPVQAFERELGAFLGTPVMGVSSGTDALLLALMTLCIGPGDEVICPSFTFFSTAAAVARLGAKPVFVDSCPYCFCLDPTKVKELVNRRTKAIIPVHLFGQAADMQAIMDIARRHGLWVIEDVAQALGAQVEGQMAGTLGHFGTFSFYPTKNLSAFGDAGALTVQDPELEKKAQALRAHGAYKRYHHEYLGGNFRMDTLQAALLSVKLKYLKQHNKERLQQAARYQQAFEPLAGCYTPLLSASCGTSRMPVPQEAEILLPTLHPGRSSVWSLYTLQVLTGQRDALATALRNTGIATDVYYPLGLHAQPCFRQERLPHLPTVESLCAKVLSLPLYPGMTSQPQETVIQGLKEVMGQGDVVPLDPLSDSDFVKC